MDEKDLSRSVSGPELSETPTLQKVAPIKRPVDAIGSSSIEDSEPRFRRLFDAAQYGILVLDPVSRKITDANPYMTRLLGYTHDEFTGRNLWQIGFPKDEQALELKVRELQNKGVVRCGDFSLKTKSGDQRDVEVIIHFYVQDGPPIVQCNLHDITERKRLERELRQSEERYRALFRSIDQGFCVIEMLFDENQKPVDYLFVEVNPAFEQQTGLKEAVGKRIRELVPDLEEYWFQIYGKVALTGEPIRVENRAGALHRYYEVFAFRVDRPESRKVAILFNDITLRKQVELQLQQQARQQTQFYELAGALNRGRTIESIYDAALNAILVCLGAHRAAVRLFDGTGVMRFKAWRGLSEKYRKTLEVFSPWSPDSRTSRPICFSRLAEMPVEEWVRQANQEEGVGALAFIPLDFQGRLLGMLIVYRDAPHTFAGEEVQIAQTIAAHVAYAFERKRTEDQLRGDEQRFRTMADSVPQKIFTTRANGSVDYFNKQCLDFTGLPFEELKDWGWQQIIHPDDRPENLRQWGHSIQTGEPFQFEHRMRRHDGVYRWHLTRARAMRNAEGKAQLWIGSTTDIEDMKQAQELALRIKDNLANQAVELEQLVAERTAALRETVEELEAFSYSIAHDLRAPLRAMNNFAEILHDKYAAQLGDEGRDYLERISSSASRLDLLIQDVLNYARVIRAEIPVSPIDLDKLMRDLLKAYPEWQPPHADIQIEGGLPPVLGHQGFLTQCISNLLNNAVKFVAPGVVPRARIQAEKRVGRVRIHFQDNGIGIAPKNRRRVFRMFDQINPATEYEGTGIGLTIVRKAVERMRGKVGFESEPGKGSDFWIELQKSESEPKQHA